MSAPFQALAKDPAVRVGMVGAVVIAVNIRVYATALEGGAAWIAKPIMTALSLLARPPFPMLFFNGVASAASYLAEGQTTPYRASGPAIMAAVEQLRAD